MNIGIWEIKEMEFLRDKVEQNGSRFLIGNGFMGYRGTLEEFDKNQLVALNMAGLFDKNGDSWRESVNAPNPFYVKTTANGTELNVLTADIANHEQTLNIRCGVHERKTVFGVDGVKVTVKAERFLSMAMVLLFSSRNDSIFATSSSMTRNSKMERLFSSRLLSSLPFIVRITFTLCPSFRNSVAFFAFVSKSC